MDPRFTWEEKLSAEEAEALARQRQENAETVELIQAGIAKLQKILQKAFADKAKAEEDAKKSEAEAKHLQKKVRKLRMLLRQRRRFFR